MKKAFLTAAIILGGLSSFATSAMSIDPGHEIVRGIDDDKKADYKEIKASELPKAVADALAADFNRATLDKAYVNSKQEYKLVISVQEVTSAVHTDLVYADRYGNWIIRGKNSTLITSTTGSK